MTALAPVASVESGEGREPCRQVDHLKQVSARRLPEVIGGIDAGGRRDVEVNSAPDRPLEIYFAKPARCTTNRDRPRVNVTVGETDALIHDAERPSSIRSGWVPRRRAPDAT